MKLEANDLSWTAGGTVIVDGITVQAGTGRILGVLGPNGSGKSTLLNMLARIVEPRTGEVRLEGRPVRDWGRRELARTMAVVQQQVTTEHDLPVRDVIDLGRIPHRSRWAGESDRDRQAVVAAATRTGVDDLLDRRWHTLSGGEQQRVHIARAFAQQGQILLFDEPTNHLDIAYQLDVLATVRGAGVTVIMALHDLNLATAYCDDVLVLSKGRAVRFGPPAQVLTPELIEEVYGVKVRLLHPAPDEPPLFQFLRPSGTRSQ